MSGGLGNLIKTLQIDTRLLGMVGAFVLIALVFHIATGGTFLTPRNLFTLTLQTASVAVMATGMVFVIVTRNIDLSIGSLLGIIGMVMGVIQVQILPDIFGFGSPAIWLITVAIGIFLGRNRFLPRFCHWWCSGLVDRLSRDPVLYRDPWWLADLARWRLVGVARHDHLSA